MPPSTSICTCISVCQVHDSDAYPVIPRGFLVPSPAFTQVEMSKNKIPYLVTHDGRTIRYPDPLIKVGRRHPYRL